MDDPRQIVEELYRKYLLLVISAVRNWTNRCGCRCDRQSDLVQEVFTRALAAVRNGNYSADYPAAWLTTIARNLSVDHCEKDHKRRPDYVPVATASSPFDVSDLIFLSECIEKLTNRADVQTFLTYRKRVEENQDPNKSPDQIRQDIVTELGISLTSLYSRCCRGRERLRECIEKRRKLSNHVR